jgi:drug/metabolite transporter (DMT)-like permease
MPAGLLFGLGAALAWGFVDVMASISGRRLGSLRVLAGAQIASILTLGLVALVTQTGLPADHAVIVAASLAGLAAAGAYLSFFTALRIGPLAVVSPTVAAYGGLTVILAVVFRGEALTVGQALGAIVSTAGVILAGIVFDGGLRGTRFVSRGIGFAVVALVCFAVVTVGMAGPIKAAGWLPVVLLSRLVNTAASCVLLGVALASRSSRARPFLTGTEAVATSPAPAASELRMPAIVGVVLLAGLVDVIGLMSFAIGLEVAETWLVGLASSFGPAVAVVVAVVVLGERLRPTQWLGLGGIAAGLVFVAIS